MIRAKDEASKSFNNVAGNMRKASAAADAASARARAAALRAQAVQAKASGATADQVRALQSSARAWDDQAKTIDRTVKKHQKLGESINNVGHASIIAGAAIAVGGAATLYGLSKAVQVAADWDKQVRLTFTQVDKKYKPSLASLGDIGLRVASKIAVPFEGVQEALFDVFSSTEANLPQAEKLLTSFAKAAVAGNTDIQTASRATIGLMNAYQIPFKDVNKVLDVQFKLVREGVGTYEEWAQRIGLVTPSAVRAGQSIDTMAAALATSTRLGVSSARSGTAVARAFDAMSNPKTEAALENIGVASRDANGNFRPMVDVLTDWRNELEKMPKEDRVKSILETLKGAGSTIEARRFLQNMLLTKGGLELFQNQIKTFATDKGAFQSAYNEMAGSVSAKSQLLHNNWMALKLAIGQALLPAFLQLVGGVSRLVDWFNKLSPGAKQTIAQFMIWGSVLSIIAGAVIVVVGALVGLIGTVVAAGSAMLPIIGVVVGVGAALTAIVAIVIGFGAAIYMAYQRSQNFRDMLLTVWNTVQAGWQILVSFAQGVYQAFMTNLMPAIKSLASVIETSVLPAIQGFVAWARTNLLPMAQTVAEFVKNQLAGAFKTAADVINSQVIPAIKDATIWWNNNKASILPVIMFLGKVVAASAMLAAFFAGTLIKGLIAGAGAFIYLARVGITLAINTFRFLYGSIQMVIGIFRIAISAIVSWVSSISKGMGNAQNTIRAAIGSIRGAFSGAGAWLVDAGRNMIQGLIGGIQGMVGAAADAAANLASTAINAAKAKLHIASPSKVFKDIGANVVRGFVLGISGNAKKVSDQMFKLTQAVKKSIMDADISKNWKKTKWDAWSKRLSKDSKKLNADAAKRASLQTKLAAATKSYNDQLKVRNDLAGKIKESIAASADLTSLDDAQKASSTTMIAGLKTRLQAVAAFAKGLQDLAKRGLDKQTVADLASQGVDAAGAMVNTLTHSSTADLKQISSIQAQIRKMAGDTGTKVAGDLYNAGINAAKGLMNGLNSQIKNITREMTNIANALVKEIKKKLGIKSPSTVFAEIGRNTALGYVNGYVKKMNESGNALSAATMFNPVPIGNVSGTPPLLPGYSGQASSKVVNLNTTINTQEIDPRKTSAQLGWELAGMVN
jgi:TP901 family phage tail tape measure protein